MASQKSTSVGEYSGTTPIQIVPPPQHPFDLYLPPGGLLFHNADSTAQTFILQLHKGGLSVEIFNSELRAGEGFAWPFALKIGPDTDGIWGSLGGGTATNPTWWWNGFLLEPGPINPALILRL